VKHTDITENEQTVKRRNSSN